MVSVYTKKKLFQNILLLILCKTVFKNFQFITQFRPYTLLELFSVFLNEK